MAHHCHARGCSISTPPEKLMCLRHWRMVPVVIQRAVWRTYRPGQCDDKRPSMEWHRAADAAIAAVAIKERRPVSKNEMAALESFGDIKGHEGEVFNLLVASDTGAEPLRAEKIIPLTRTMADALLWLAAFPKDARVNICHRPTNASWSVSSLRALVARGFAELESHTEFPGARSSYEYFKATPAGRERADSIRAKRVARGR